MLVELFVLMPTKTKFRDEKKSATMKYLKILTIILFTCNPYVIDKDNKNIILSIYSMFIINTNVQYNIVTYDVIAFVMRNTRESIILRTLI